MVKNSIPLTLQTKAVGWLDRERCNISFLLMCFLFILFCVCVWNFSPCLNNCGRLPTSKQKPSPGPIYRASYLWELGVSGTRSDTHCVFSELSWCPVKWAWPYLPQLYRRKLGNTFLWYAHFARKEGLTSKSKFTLYLKDFKTQVFFCLLKLGEGG